MRDRSETRQEAIERLRRQRPDPETMTLACALIEEHREALDLLEAHDRGEVDLTASRERELPHSR